MKDFLKKAVREKRKEILKKREEKPIEDLFLKITPSKKSFFGAISKKRKSVPHIIAEIKAASPSKGIIRKDIDVAGIAKMYEKYASAVSVVTESTFFKGSMEYVSLADKACSLPILAKDFILDKYQIYEARNAGADAVLLISRILSQDDMEELIAVARGLEMDVLVEANSRKDLIKALQTSAGIIGINNRDLGTFKIDLSRTLNLIHLIPKEKIIVSESGYFEKKHLEAVHSRINAVLIGTAILREENMEKKLKELTCLQSEMAG